MRTALVLVALALCASTAAGFYLPGIIPVDYKDGSDVFINVNSLRSIRAVVPFQYYYLPFCRADPSYYLRRRETIGEVLWGDHIEPSPYVVRMKQDNKCMEVPCSRNDRDEQMKPGNVKELTRLIEENYRGGMVLDNLPVFNNGTLPYQGRCKNDLGRYEYLRGYALGVPRLCTGGDTLVNNHLHFRIQYHQYDADSSNYRVVGFTVEPFSIKHTPSSCSQNFNPRDPTWATLNVKDLETTPVKWTYSVEWMEEKNIRWASRWDSYLSTSFADSNARVHWMAIINSLLVVLCLGSIVSMVLLRALRKDFTRYNAQDPDDIIEEFGWKLVYRDVFRPPQKRSLLAVCVSTGAQLFGMVALTLVFALLGFLSPANRGALLTSLILLFALQSIIAGGVCAMVLQFFQARSWKTVFALAVAFPGLVFAVFFVDDIMLWSMKAANAVPFPTMAKLIAIWFGISVPLTVLGASFGFRRPATAAPVAVASIAREIPPQRWYLTSPFIIIVPGLIPFGAAFVELRYIFSSLWQGMVYYVFGFLSLVFVIWLFTSILTTIVAVYYQLCYEDYRWWWRSFFIPSGCGVPFFIYIVHYYNSEIVLNSGAASVLYFTYMTLVCLAYILISGFVGVSSAWTFVNVIYKSIRVE